jgi:hypothetical protein
MNALEREYVRFEASSTRQNPSHGGGAGDISDFIRHLSAEKTLGEFKQGDWVEFGRNKGLNDDQIGSMLEGTATWIVDEKVPVSEQEPADWPEDTSKLRGGRSEPSLSPVPRGNPQESTPRTTSAARRGTPEFDELMGDLVDGYVDARYPGLTGYAYQAEMLDPEKGTETMESILDDIVELRWPEDAHPEFRLKGEDNWRSIEDTEDFPQPSADPVDDAEGEEEEAEDEGAGCFDDCKCPDSCGCGPCPECEDGNVCCCPCTVDG